MLRGWAGRIWREPVGRVRLGLAALAAPFAVHLFTGANPWERELWDRIDLQEGISPDQAMAFLVFASLLVLLLIAGLAWSARWWCAGEAPARLAQYDPRSDARRGLRWALVAAAMVVLAVQAIQRLDHSLWYDEDLSARRAIHGLYLPDDEGGAEWETLRWWETFWAYRGPNNHVPFSVLSRISVRGYEKLVGQPVERVRVEVALRLPALLLGLLLLAAVAALGTRLGLPWAGVATAWLLAVHPWVLRYTSAARGYSLLLCLTALYWLATFRLLERGSWLRFAVWGGLQAALLWLYLGSLWLLVFTNLFVLYELWVSRRAAPELGLAVALRRGFVTTLASAGAFVWIMTPNLLQLIGYLRDRAAALPGARFLRDVGSLFLIGSRYGSRNGDPLYPNLLPLALQAPVLYWGTAALCVLLWSIGCVRLARRGGAHARFLACLVLPIPATYLFATWSQTFMHPYYFIVGFLGVALPVAIGCTSPAAARGPWARNAAIALSAATILLVAWIGAPVREALIERPIAAIRESALLTRPTLAADDPRNREILTICPNGIPWYYDPRCQHIRTPEAMRALLHEADARGIPLFVAWDYPSLLRKRTLALLDLVTTREDVFEPIAVLPGFEANRTRHVHRYRPGTVALIEP